MTKKKKRVQVQIDKDLCEKVEIILDDLGMTKTTAISLFFKRIAGEGEIPFKISLSDKERSQYSFLKKNEKSKTENIDADKNADNWLDEPDW